EGHGAGVVPARGAVAQQQQRGAKQLPLHAEEVLVHFTDDRKVGSDDAPQLVHHLLELRGDRELDVAQRDPGECDLLAHVTVPWPGPWPAVPRRGSGCPPRIRDRTGRGHRPSCPAPRAPSPANTGCPAAPGRLRPAAPGHAAGSTPRRRTPPSRRSTRPASPRSAVSRPAPAAPSAARRWPRRAGPFP